VAKAQPAGDHKPRAGEVWKHRNGKMFDIIAVEKVEPMRQDTLNEFIVVSRDRTTGRVRLMPFSAWFRKLDGRPLLTFFSLKNQSRPSPPEPTPA